jgi:hypothetical protein
MWKSAYLKRPKCRSSELLNPRIVRINVLAVVRAREADSDGNDECYGCSSLDPDSPSTAAFPNGRANWTRGIPSLISA